MKDLHELFINELKLIYDAEKQIVHALPHVIHAASSQKLKEALKNHLDETKNQVERLEKISKEIGQKLSGMPSEPMKVFLKEADNVIKSDFQQVVKDAALINCAQHVEHFEIASYGILKSLAKMFEYDTIFQLLEESSKEEGHANKTLNKIAEGTFYNKGINNKALKKRAA